jgi:hypothetical protein
MNQHEFDKVKSSLSFLKKLGVLDRKPEKSIITKASVKFEVAKRKQLVDSMGE